MRHMSDKDSKDPILLTTHGAATPYTSPTTEREVHYHREPDREHRATHREGPPAHGLAVASLVTGILGFVGLFVVGPILALVFGYSARSRIKERTDVGGDGMAVAGIILGWIGLIATAVVIGLGAAFFNLFA